jgi:hypothetical protein
LKRREILKAGLAAGSLFVPQPWAWVWAQSDGTVKLLKAPKVALVVGNGKYKDAPELKNAPNDAKAVGEALKASGFAVTMLLDTSKDALVDAIRKYVHEMEQKKCVGLFYFAGHGVQLEWRNYMLPIDAVIDRIEDVGKQSVDVARLMEGLTKAANPMNIIILDACRENPFGTAKPVAQKGLSQMDAPNQTILAYATSPGNVASDGEGVNGLYTENLLREMKVPETTIENVFKRVRLGVRKGSKGAQIPWESTSLEDDFWFLPPKELRKISDEEKERRFKEERAAWQKAEQAAQLAAAEAAKQAAEQEAARRAVEEARKAAEEAAARAAKAASDAAARQAAEQARLAAEKAAKELAERTKAQAVALAPLEDYMRQYPSGNFSELAQLQMEILLKQQGENRVRIVSSEGNPYTKGTQIVDLNPKVGYSTTHSVMDAYSKAEIRRRTRTIASVTDTEIIWKSGAVTDLLGNLKRLPNGNTTLGNQSEPLEYTLGKHWTTRYTSVQPGGFSSDWSLTHRITKRERVTVPAGTFDAWKIETLGTFVRSNGLLMFVEMRRWMAPDKVRGEILSEEIRKGAKGGALDVFLAERVELISFSQP